MTGNSEVINLFFELVPVLTGLATFRVVGKPEIGRLRQSGPQSGDKTDKLQTVD
jgi:hypothetical protein